MRMGCHPISSIDKSMVMKAVTRHRTPKIDSAASQLNMFELDKVRGGMKIGKRRRFAEVHQDRQEMTRMGFEEKIVAKSFGKDLSENQHFARFPDWHF